MLDLLRRLFDIRSGEGGIVARAALTLAGLIAAHTMLETARDALFLGKLPVSRLSLVYAALAALSIGAAKANARFVRAFGRRNGLIITLLAAGFGTMVLYLLEPTETVVFALYLWTGLLGSVLVVQFWMLVGHLFTVSQGKRLFGLLAAGGVAGAVVGAVGAAAVLAVVEVRELLVASSALFLATAFHLTNDQIDDPPRSQEDEEDSPGLSVLRRYPYLVRLAALVVVSTSAVLATDYLFKTVIAQSVPAEDLGSFFAKYYAGLNAVALVLQLFVSSVIVRRMGVIGAFLVLPVLLMVGGATSLVFGLAGVLVTKGADGALRHSLHRIASELLWLPLPESVRAQAKAAVDTVMVRGAQAGTAAVLLALAAADLDDPRILVGVVIVLAALWIGLGLGLRRPYIALFREALGQRTADEHIQLDLRAVEVVVEALSSREATEAIAAMELLEASSRTRLIPALILYHESKEVLLRALEMIPSRSRKDWIPLAERLLEHDDPAVRVAALEALARNQQYQAVAGRLLDISPWVRAHAAFWTVHLETATRPIEHPAVRAVLEMDGPSGIKGRVGLLEAAEASGDERWSNLLLELAESSQIEVAQAAVRAMTQIADPRFIPLLVRRLRFRPGRSVTRAALVALGDDAFDALTTALFSEETEARLRAHIPAAIGRFENERSARALLEALEDERLEGRVRFAVLRALVVSSERRGRDGLDAGVLERRVLRELEEFFRSSALHAALRTLFEDSSRPGRESGEILADLLRDKRDQALDRVFLLLQVCFPNEDLRSVRSATRSPDRLRRSQAQEFLDALTLGARLPELRPLIRIAVDELDEAEKLTRAQDILGAARTMESTEALQALLQDADTSIAGLAAYHVLESGEPALREAAEITSRERPMSETLRDLVRGFSTLEEAPRFA